MMDAPRRVVVWRHGRTAWNQQHRFQGTTDVPLDEVGLLQVELAAGYLERLKPTTVIASDARRTRETTAVLSARMGGCVTLDPRLREAHIGAWEGLTRAEVAHRFPDEYDAWRAGTDTRRGNGETLEEVASRAGEAVDEALSRLLQAGTLLVVTHGGTARALVGRLLQLPPEHWRTLGTLGHARWSVLEERQFGWRLAEHNSKAPRRRPDSAPRPAAPVEIRANSI
jgi:broad specificity phosphatase PhoE